MNRVLSISQILVYYDFPHIFTANDQVGTDYLCMLVSLEEELPLYVATQISKNRLIGFLNGSIDLREIFESPELKQWFTFYSENENYFEVEEVTELPDDYLPDEGFKYKNHEKSDDIIVSESVEYSNAVVHLAVSDEHDNY